jgi:hypothetical protein
MSAASIAERIAARLAPYLGPHTARVAVKTFTARGLGRVPETLTREDVPSLTLALRPMLRTLVGKQRAEAVAQEILKEFGL